MKGQEWLYINGAAIDCARGGQKPHEERIAKLLVVAG